MTSQRLEFPGRQQQTLAGRLERPDGVPRAYAIFAHCFTCSKDSHAATRISRALSERGYAVLRFDFTGLGGSEGDFANTDFSSNVGDLIAAADHLRQHHAAPRLLVGHSLGGAAALAAAFVVPEVAAVATLGAPSDPLHVKHLLTDAISHIETTGSAEVRIAGRAFRIRREFLADLEEQNLLARLRDLRRAALILHSPADEVVGIDHARRLYEALRHPKSFVTLDDADHLLTRPRDAEYVAEVLAAWASRYVEDADADHPPQDAPPPGRVTVRGGPTPFRQDVLVGRHRLVADEPESVPGGTGLGPNPYELLQAALGACTSMTLQMYAGRKQWPLAAVEVDIAHDRIHAEDCADCETTDGKIDVFRRRIRMQGPLDDGQRARMREIADRCPVHRTLSSEIRIETELA